MRSKLITIGAAAAALCAAPSAAQEHTRTIEIPELVSADGKYGDDRKYFVFHKAGVSFEHAERDIATCLLHAARGKVSKMPRFVPWRENERQTERTSSGGTNYGPVGVVIGSIVDGPILRGIRQAIMMRCMMPRGYSRYAVTKSTWIEIHTGDDAAQSVAMQAAIASGDTPKTPEVTS